MDCTADPPKTRLNSGSGQLNRGCSQVICLQREKHARWNPLFSNFLFSLGGRWMLAGHSPSSMTHIHSPLIITVVFPWGDFKVSLFFFGWELIIGHLLFPTPGSLFSRFFPYLLILIHQGLALNLTPLRDCLWNIPQPLQTSQAAERGRHAHWLLQRSPWGHQQSGTTEWARTHARTHAHTHTAGSRFHACTLAAKKSRRIH